MKLFLKTSLATLLFIDGSCYALNPVQGWYGGIFLGGSKSSAIQIPVRINNVISEKGKLDYSFYGDIGGQIGYRMDQFRVEGELSYNHSPYNALTFNGFTISHTPKHPNTGVGLKLKGSTTIAAFMLNGYYDFFTCDDDCSIVPFVGFGLGLAHVQNRMSLYYNGVRFADAAAKISNSSHAEQAILGVSYFLDDFTAFALDFRYFTTGTVTNKLGPLIEPDKFKPKYMAINLTFNGSFDAG